MLQTLHVSRDQTLKNVTDAISKRNIFTTPYLYPFLSHPQKFYIPRNTTYINKSCHTIHCVQQSLIVILIHEHHQILYMTVRRPAQCLSTSFACCKLHSIICDTREKNNVPTKKTKTEKESQVMTVLSVNRNSCWRSSMLSTFDPWLRLAAM